MRTKYIDDAMERFARAGPRQVVNLGSGLCTRPYRMGALDRCRANYEIDLPDVVRAKTRLIRQAGARALCPLVTLTVDLTGAPGTLECALLSAGFDPSVPTLFVAEGLSMYLSAEVNRRLFEESNRISAPGSLLLVGFISESALLPKSIPFTIEPAEMRALFSATGWRDPSVSVYGDASLSFGRYPKDRGPDTSQCFCIASK